MAERTINNPSARPGYPASGAKVPDPPRISIALNAFGGAAIISAVLFLGGSFYVENEIGRAFCLGAFFSGLLGAILLFGFAKVIDQLDAIRVHAERAARIPDSDDE